MRPRDECAARRRPFAGAVCLALAVIFLLPLAGGILHVGMVWPAALLLLATSLCFWPRWPGYLPHALRRTAAAAIGIGLAAALIILALMATAALHRPDEADPPATVIVLGCQAYADGRPSTMLQNRIDAAYDYLTAHPEAVCIASGGMDDQENITEAACIRTTLLSMGIAPERIYLEDASGSTYENMAFSAALIRENGLDTRVVLATDNFHQYRSQFFARQAGLTPCASGCAAYLPMVPGYWAREVAGVAAAWIRGY
ncbi:MAG: YdcF family protein [Ruminococcaceae bacterium]|nr:YdcF family protein [Oscillospiraceae bacterium]